MIKKTALGLALALSAGAWSNSFATPLIFTYDCTIDGTGQGGTGTNSCAGGQSIAQVMISDSGLDPDFANVASNILKVEARLQFYDANPPGDRDPYGYQLDAIWLNIDETLLGSGLGDSGIAWNDGSGTGTNDYNFIWFDHDGFFDYTASPTDTRKIRVEANSTDASNWKNFDLGLCAEGQSPAQCALDLPVLASSSTDPATQPWVTLGYLNSGTLYDLIPENFDFATTNITDPGLLNYAPGCTWTEGELSSGIKIDPSATSDLFGDTSCLSGTSYGPRYGAASYEDPQIPPSENPVPAPATLALMGLGLLGLRISRRQKTA